jgi:hypothetical protein
VTHAASGHLVSCMISRCLCWPRKDKVVMQYSITYISQSSFSFSGCKGVSDDDCARPATLPLDSEDFHKLPQRLKTRVVNICAQASPINLCPP